ncbi:hypothetical protein COO60DRAFT_599971, partial [Scenedesmus sp. NREL 46B-D3]
MFLEKEENSVIRVERLEHELAAATAPEQLNALHKDFVDFHGEVLLLVHWSILAYTATVKILKKHHKRTGLLVKAPQLGNLLSQPFCSTEVCWGAAGSAGSAECCVKRVNMRAVVTTAEAWWVRRPLSPDRSTWGMSGTVGLNELAGWGAVRGVCRGCSCTGRRFDTCRCMILVCVGGGCFVLCMHTMLGQATSDDLCGGHAPAFHRFISSAA